MDHKNAVKLLDETFNREFDLDRFSGFIKELFNHFSIRINNVPIRKEYYDYVDNVTSLGVYRDENKDSIEVFSVKLKKTSSRDRARTMQRNLIAKYLENFNTDAALVAFYGDDPQDWRFSFVKMEYDLIKDEKDNLKVRKELTPARRFSYLVGQNEPNHTCRQQFLGLVKEESIDPKLEQIESAFSIENVTKEFFNGYKELYLKLKESLENSIENDEVILQEFEDKIIKTSDFSKKLMGQIVFIYFLQKKGWLGVEKGKEWGTGPKRFLRKLFDKEIIEYNNFFNDVLEYFFYEALASKSDDDYYERFKCKIPFLNGGLFEPINDYDWKKTNINLKNEIFKEILDTFDRFNFTVREDEPLEKEVAVDPEMLGKVFENLLEIEDRKSRGAFYTPREIVHYMCQESLINYLYTNSKVNKEDIENFIRMGDVALGSIIKEQEQIKKYNRSYDKSILPDSIRGNHEKLENLLTEIKVVDPAVGSGAFPVGMMNEIIRARTILSLYSGKNVTNYEFKLETIKNCLYGVDIDSSAVDIAKLRFWLSLIVDKDDVTVIDPLPNLDHKIMCGNSLLEEYDGIKLFDENILLNPASIKKEPEQITLYDERLQESRKKLKRLKELHKLFFNEQNKKQKDQYTIEIEKIEWDFIEETLKEEGNDDAIQKLEQYKKSNSKPFFLWKLYFAEVFQRENPGFDVVIANPPYVRQEKIKDIKKFLKENYFTYTGVADLYVYFFEKGINVLRKGGNLAFISSNKFTRAKYGGNLRNFLLENQIKIYNDHTGEKIFQEATVDPCVILIKKTPPKPDDMILIDNSFEMAQKRLNKNSWSFYSPEILDLRDKINNKGVKLKKIKGLNFYRGILTGYNTAFVIDKKTKDYLVAEDSKSEEIIKPFLRGRDIKKWMIDYQNLYLIFTRRGIDIDDYPAIKEHLIQFKDRLTPKNNGETIGRKPGDYQWYEIQDTIAYYQEFEKPKIIYPNMASSLFTILDEDNYYTNQKCFIITSNDINIKYLSALLSSKVLNFVFSLLGSPLGKAGYDLSKIYIEQLPVHVDETKKTSIIQKTEEIIILNKKILKKCSNFKNSLSEEFHINKLSKKLDSYYELSLEELYSELRKKKYDLKLKNNNKKLEERFISSLNIIKPLILEIGQIENELDSLVYELYELNSEEIKIIEDFNNSKNKGD